MALGGNLSRSTRVARDPRRFMAFGAIEGNRTRPFDSGGAGSQALQGLGCDRIQLNSPVRLGWREIPQPGCNQRQSNSPVRFGWRGIQGASWPWVRSNPIELACSTRVARDTTAWVRSKATELTGLTRVAWDPRRFMALEGNRTLPFDSDGAGYQAFHGLQCD